MLKLKDHLVSHTFILQVSLLSEGHRVPDLSQGREASLLLKQIGTFIFQTADFRIIQQCILA